MRHGNEELRRWFGLVLAAGALGIGVAAVSHQAMAQGTQPRRPGFPPEGEGPGNFGGRFGGGGFGGPMGMGPGMGMGMGMMGGSSMTANQNTVFVLRGNRLFAFDANSLRLKAQAEVPMMEPRGEDGAGRGGFGGGRGGPGGRPEREENRQ